MNDRPEPGLDPLTLGKVLGVGAGVAIGWTVIFVCATEIALRYVLHR